LDMFDEVPVLHNIVEFVTKLFDYTWRCQAWSGKAYLFQIGSPIDQIYYLSLLFIFFINSFPL
jgi:hypothetical protein